MRFRVPVDFDLAAFIAAVAAGGCHLEASDAFPNPCGSLRLESSVLSVVLGEENDPKEALIAKEAIERGAEPI